jgi:hypothetical protein
MANAWNADFPDDVIYDAAVFSAVIDGTRQTLGMLEGEPGFDPKAEYRNPTFNGKRHRVAGMTRVTGWDSEFKFTLKQIGATSRALLFPGSTETVVGSETEIAPKSAGELFAVSDLLEAPQLAWARGDGGLWIVRFYYGFVEDAKVNGKDKEEAGIEVLVKAEVDPTMTDYSTDMCPFIYAQSAA